MSFQTRFSRFLRGATVCLSLVSIPSCKHIGSDASADLTGDGTIRDCGAPLSPELALRMSERAHVHAAAFAAARLTLADAGLEIDREADALAKDAGSGADQKAVRARLRATGLAALESVTSAGLLPLILSSGDQLPESFDLPVGLLARLEAMGVPSWAASDYLDDARKLFAPALKTLRAAGADYTLQAGWNLERFQFTDRDPRLGAAVATIFGTKVLAELRNRDRTTALEIEGWIALPPRAGGEIEMFTRADWEAGVRESLRRFSVDVDEFIASTLAAATYWNLTTGRLIELFGGERGHGGRTAPEIAAAEAMKRMTQMRNDLANRRGVAASLTGALNETMSILNQIEMQQLEAGLKKLKAAERAAIAAPFIPVVIYAAPYAGGLVGPAFAGSVGASSAAAALTPLAMAYGSAALRATLAVTVEGRPADCMFYEALVERGSAAMFQAPFFAAMPPGSALLARGTAIVSGGQVFASTAHGVINVSLAVIGVGTGTAAGVSGFAQCRNGLLSFEKEVNAAGSASPSAMARLSDTIQQCTEAGIQIAQTSLEATRLTTAAIDAIRTRNTQPLKAPSCGGAPGVALTAGPGSCALSGQARSFDELQRELTRPIELTPDEAAAVAAYSGSAFRPINEGLRWGSVPQAYQDIVAKLDSAIAKSPELPKDMITWRGSSFNPQAPQADRIAAVGETLEFRSYTSTSINQKLSQGFGSGAPGTVVYEIKPPPGRSLRGLFVPNVPGNRYPNEAEVLLPRGSRFRVLERVDGVREVSPGGATKPFVKMVLEMIL
jgi:hypothetical protein